MTQTERDRAEKAANKAEELLSHFSVRDELPIGSILDYCEQAYLAGYEQALKDAEKLKD